MGLVLVLFCFRGTFILSEGNRSATCCFTGHRRIPLSERPALEQRLEEAIEHLIHQGVRYFGAGGGFGPPAHKYVETHGNAAPHFI